MEVAAIACQQLVAHATEYLEGALPRERLLAVERHLELCEPCRNYLDQMRRVIRALHGLKFD